MQFFGGAQAGFVPKCPRKSPPKSFTKASQSIISEKTTGINSSTPGDGKMKLTGWVKWIWPRTKPNPSLYKSESFKFVMSQHEDRDLYIDVFIHNIHEKATVKLVDQLAAYADHWPSILKTFALTGTDQNQARDADPQVQHLFLHVDVGGFVTTVWGQQTKTTKKITKRSHPFTFLSKSNMHEMNYCCWNHKCL